MNYLLQLDSFSLLLTFFSVYNLLNPNESYRWYTYFNPIFQTVENGRLKTHLSVSATSKGELTEITSISFLDLLIATSSRHHGATIVSLVVVVAPSWSPSSSRSSSSSLRSRLSRSLLRSAVVSVVVSVVVVALVQVRPVGWASLEERWAVLALTHPITHAHTHPHTHVHIHSLHLFFSPRPSTLLRGKGALLYRWYFGFGSARPAAVLGVEF